MTWRLAALVAWTGTVLVALAPAGPALDGRESLQALLLRLRLQRDQLLGALQGQVQAEIEQLEAQALARDIERMEETRARLVQLGPEAAPLFLEKLDPGTSPTDAERLRSLYLALAIAELRTATVTARLVEIAQAGSTDGKLNAIRALGGAPDKERATPVLVGLARGGDGLLRAPALVALAQLGGPEAQQALGEALGDARAEVSRAALEGLAQARSTALLDEVLKVTASPGAAFRALDPLLAYYRAVADAVPAAHVAALVRLASDPSAPASERVRVLELLPRFADRYDADIKKSLKALTESPSREMSEGALVVLCLAGDKNARRDLIGAYDERIDRNKDYATAWQERADVLYRIGEYREAINDYRQALKLAQNDLRTRLDGAYIGLARCHARMGKVKEAAQTLEKAPLTRQQLSDLKSDPAFAKLVESGKYRELFDGP